jgi:CDP-diacylglycerol--serine O-phosphatidyltransferase
VIVLAAPSAAPSVPALAPLTAVADSLPATSDSLPTLDVSPSLNSLFDAAAAKKAGALAASPAFHAAPADAPAPSPAPRLDPPSKEPLKRRAVKNLPNAVTGLNLTSGLGAIYAATHGGFTLAVGLIILAAVFDMLDGRVARAVKADGPLGLQLDSLADVVSFGAAPALLAFEAALHGAGLGGAALAAAFAFAGAYRLARFNLGVAKPEPALEDSFTGLPIPGGAGVVAAAVLLLPLLPGGLGLLTLSLATGVAALAMVSRLPYPALKKAPKKALLAVAGAALAATAALAAFGLWPYAPAAVFGAYLLAGPLRRLSAKR